MTLTDITNSGLIIGRYLAKQNITQISREMEIPKYTITDCRNKLSERDQRTVVRNFREQPFVSFVEHTAKLKDVGINIRPQTLLIYTCRKGFGSLAWAQEKVNWTPKQWRSVIWSDESKFNVNGSDGRIRVIRKEGKRFSPYHVHKTVKFGNGSIMIWGCFWAGGLGPIVTMKRCGPRRLCRLFIKSLLSLASELES
ncbi:hypothetical protein [Parasitella parasitica]|uniref:Transposase Tc1-like domain-containing protein n=1 Tax=Parasitella parasitica TaxID=35722 RepID=A0A0B7NHB3_9FUNG|nr:hypothetical protein [Parasitella parasitica]